MKRLIVFITTIVLPFIAWAVQMKYEDTEYHVVYAYENYGTEAEVSKSPNASGNIIIRESINVGGKVYKVTKIGEDAFRNRDISSVFIPETITAICFGAFINCQQLTSLTLPPNVTFPDYSVFVGCKRLRQIVSLSEIPLYAKPDVSIGLHYKPSPFYDISDAAVLCVPKGSIDKYRQAEVWCDFTNILEIEDYGEYKHNDIVYGYSKSKKEAYVMDAHRTFGNVIIPAEINIPEKGLFQVKRIAGNAFYENLSVSNVQIPETLEYIGDEAFARCSAALTSIYIPSGVKHIGHAVFCNYGVQRICDSNKTITVSKDNLVYDSREDCNAIIETATNTLITGCENTIIPNSINKIEEYAFMDCNGLKSIEIPEGVSIIGDEAFERCSNLKHIKLPESLTELGEYTFCGCDLQYIEIPKSVSLIYGSLCANESLKTVILHEGLYSIDHQAFDCCYSLENISLPEGLKTIGYKALSYCTSLTSINIPSSVTSISYNAFEGCTALSSIKCMVKDPIKNVSFYGLNIYNITLYVPKGSKSKYESAYEWKDFGNIIEFEEIIEKVDETHVSDSNTMETFHINGIYGNSLRNNISIIREPKGNVKKVIKREK